MNLNDDKEVMGRDDKVEEPLVALPPVSEQVKKLAINAAVYNLVKNNNFYGSLLQELNVKYDDAIPTAAVWFDKDKEQFQVGLGTRFFTSLPLEQATAVLHHEVLHFTNNHLFRVPFMNFSKEKRQLFNIAADMAINQYIPHIPKESINVDDWKQVITDDQGIDSEQPFPKWQSMETYVDLLKNKKNEKANEGMYKKYKEFDKHDWEQLDEETKKKLLREAKKVIDRTIEKTQHGHNNLPGGIKDLLKEIETLATTLDYRGILRRAIKKTLSANDRDATWKRPSKRYGKFSPGTKAAQVPNCAMYIDTSGSISYREANEFLAVVGEFLKAGARQCVLNLWHTELYYKKKFKLSQKLEQTDIQGGGTDPTCVLADIVKAHPDLSIILTDGHYSDSVITPSNEIIWIISKGGNMEHPLKRIGKTISLDSLKGE